jgi:hypothetical protein
MPQRLMPLQRSLRLSPSPGVQAWDNESLARVRSLRKALLH